MLLFLAWAHPGRCQNDDEWVATGRAAIAAFQRQRASSCARGMRARTCMQDGPTNCGRHNTHIVRAPLLTDQLVWDAWGGTACASGVCESRNATAAAELFTFYSDPMRCSGNAASLQLAADPPTARSVVVDGRECSTLGYVLDAAAPEECFARDVAMRMAASGVTSKSELAFFLQPAEDGQACARKRSVTPEGYDTITRITNGTAATDLRTHHGAEPRLACRGARATRSSLPLTRTRWCGGRVCGQAPDLLVQATFDAVLPAGAASNVTLGLRSLYRYSFAPNGTCTGWEATYDPAITVALAQQQIAEEGAGLGHAAGGCVPVPAMHRELAVVAFMALFLGTLLGALITMLAESYSCVQPSADDEEESKPFGDEGGAYGAGGGPDID